MFSENESIRKAGFWLLVLVAAAVFSDALGVVGIEERVAHGLAEGTDLATEGLRRLGTYIIELGGSL